MRNRRFAVIRTLALATVLPLALAACGGGGDTDSTEKFDAQGLYRGTLTGGSDALFYWIVLDNGEFWAVIGRETLGKFAAERLIQGSNRFENGAISFSNVRDYGYITVTQSAASATGSYKPSDRSFSATVSRSDASNSSSFTFNASAVASSDYDYNAAASNANLVGTWFLGSSAGLTTRLVINADGSLQASLEDYRGFTGTIRPRAGGKNVYDVVLTPTATTPAASGIALLFPQPDGGKPRLLMIVRDPTTGYRDILFSQ